MKATDSSQSTSTGGFCDTSEVRKTPGLIMPLNIPGGNPAKESNIFMPIRIKKSQSVVDQFIPSLTVGSSGVVGSKIPTFLVDGKNADESMPEERAKSMIPFVAPHQELQMTQHFLPADIEVHVRAVLINDANHESLFGIGETNQILIDENELNWNKDLDNRMLVRENAQDDPNHHQQDPNEQP